jgi:hypothetical protein
MMVNALNIVLAGAVVLQALASPLPAGDFFSTTNVVSKTQQVLQQSNISVFCKKVTTLAERV